MPSYKRTVEIPGKSADDLYQKVASDIEVFLSKTSIKGYEIERATVNRQVSVKSSMFNVTLICEDGRVRLDGSLSLMAMPFKGMLDDGIDKWLAKTFPVA